jgi:YesN/AraC family two-component response regulator
VKTTQPQQDRTSTQEPQPPTHRIMACLSKYREYREQFDRLQLIEEDFFKYSFDEVEGTTPDQSKERSKERSRGNSNNSAYSNQSRASSRASSTSSLDGQLKAVQYHTTASHSRNKHQKVKMPSLFRNQSPSSRKVWEDSYFMETKNPEKFKDVMSSKKCLRCYSSKHLANACRRFRTPCPTPCIYCRYLFHPHSECHMHDSAGSVRSKN